MHGDVFRKPNYSTFLSVMAGSGMQLLGMSVVGSPEDGGVLSSCLDSNGLGKALGTGKNMGDPQIQWSLFIVPHSYPFVSAILLMS